MICAELMFLALLFCSSEGGKLKGNTSIIAVLLEHEDIEYVIVSYELNNEDTIYCMMNKVTVFFCLSSLCTLSNHHVVHTVCTQQREMIKKVVRVGHPWTMIR